MWTNAMAMYAETCPIHGHPKSLYIFLVIKWSQINRDEICPKDTKVTVGVYAHRS